jgi:hypothetical protein
MPPSPTDQYQAFWNRLQSAYPISKGQITIPIVSELITIPHLNHRKLLTELSNILAFLLEEPTILQSAKDRAIRAGESYLTPLINSDYTGVVRFDCLWNPETSQISILEINCDYPDGLLLHDKTYSVLAGTDSRLHHNLLNQLYGRNEIAVLHSADAYFLDAYEVETRNLQDQAQGKNRLNNLAGVRPGTTIRRCLETTKMTQEMIDMCEKKKLPLINSIALRTLGYKDLLETIDHPYILQTTKVTSEVIDYCIKSKDDLVLKPIDGCEGYNIYFGQSLNQVEWSKLISQHANSNYIVQQRAHIPRLKVGLYENDTIVDKELYYDLCPHFFIKSGKVIGSGHTLMRFSEHPVVNVNQGGGIGYYKE